MTSQHRAIIATTVSLLLVAAGCNEELPAKTPRKQALESITNDIFLPMLTGVHREAQELDEAARELCEAEASERTMEQLEVVRSAWSRSCELWKQTDVMAFGPHLLSPYRFAEQIDFWPAREDSIDAVLGGDAASGEADDDAGAEPGDVPGEIPATLTASQKGFPAIEYVLFGPRAETLAAFRDAARGDHRCAYLRRMTETLVADTGELERVFRDDFAPDFTLEENPNDRYQSVNEAFGELVNNMIFTVETVRGTRLAKPLGLTVGGVPQPELVESRYSEQSIRHAIAVLDGVAMVFYGSRPDVTDFPDQPTNGIHSVLEARGIDLRARYSELFDAATIALNDIPRPLAAAVVDDREKVEAARAAITELLMLLQVDVAQALSVTATFGRNDGDGD